MLLFVSATAESGKKSSDSKAIPLEKKLDKRGLLDLGYGYGINGLDVGYLGGGHLGGAYVDDHHAHDYHHGYNGLHGYGHGIYLGGHTDVTKVHTLIKGVPVPYTVEKHVPHIVEKHVPYKVAVPVPQPYEVVKHVPVHVKEYVKVPVHVPQPYPVEKRVPYPVHVPVDRPVPVKVYVPQVNTSSYIGFETFSVYKKFSCCSPTLLKSTFHIQLKYQFQVGHSMSRVKIFNDKSAKISLDTNLKEISLVYDDRNTIMRQLFFLQLPIQLRRRFRTQFMFQVI